jgi:hypothetical protein
MLTAAMNKILTSGQLSNNFFFIIDGLDEYDRDSIGKMQLAELMLELTRSSRVKLLLSSRPDTPFKTAFQPCPTLRLEKLTGPDISAYVKKRLWSNLLVTAISGVEAGSINDIASFILNNAQGVFLWAVLTLNIALDGINNHEDLAVVLDSVTLLPRELHDMFTHILTRRISQHHKQEAFRCLFITFVWHSESVSLPELAELSYTVVSIARRASNYADACTLANSTSVESPQYFRDRLASRCQGLLDTVDGNYRTVGVTFLHRTLFDYLKEDQGARNSLQAGLGDTFDVYTAIMAALICTRKLHLYTGRNTSRVLFHFNMLAERSTGRSRSDLLAIFDQFESTMNPGPAEATHDVRLLGRKCHWSVNLFKARPPTESNLLVWAVHCGAVRHLEESIGKGEVPDVQASSKLLYYALMPIFSIEEMHDYWPIEPALAVSALLLDHGADPTHEVGTMCPWAMVLRFVARMDRSIIVTRKNSDKITAALRTLVKFAHSASDLRDCGAIEVTCRRKQLTASKAMHELLLRDICCRSRRSVETCQCPKAQCWAPMATELVRLIEGF